MQKRYLPLYIIATALPAGLFAQTTAKDTLKIDQIDVVRAFEPEVNQVSKVDFPPNLPKISSAEQPAAQKYSFNDIYRPINYKAEDLRPVKYNEPGTADASIGYVRAGFGNYLTPVFNLALANKNHSRYEAGLNVDFIYSKSKEPKFRQYHELDVAGYGEYHLDNLTLGLKAGLDLDQYYLYGYAPVPSDSISKADISRRYTVPRVGFYFYNHATNKWNLNFKGNFDVEVASTDFSAKGTNVKFGADVYREFSGNTYKAGLNLDGQVSSYDNVERSSGRTALTLTPYGAVKMGIWSLELGPVLMIDAGDVHLLPYIRNQIRVKGDALVIYNEWNSRIGYNNLISAYRSNPYLSKYIDYHNYRFQERTILGIRGALPVGVSYDARFGQHVWNEVPLFVNDTSDFKQFTQVYDEKVSAWTGHVEVGYTKTGQYSAKGSFDYYSYSTKTEAAAWHMPSLKGSISGQYFWKDKLTAGVEVIALGGIKARNAQLGVEKLSPQVDINLSANYFLNKNIGFFVELNNLLNNQNPRWNNYERFGFHGIGGVKVVF